MSWCSCSCCGETIDQGDDLSWIPCKFCGYENVRIPMTDGLVSFHVLYNGKIGMMLRDMRQFPMMMLEISPYRARKCIENLQMVLEHMEGAK